VPVTETVAVTPVLPVTVSPAAGAVMQTVAEYALLDGLLVEHDPAAAAGRAAHATPPATRPAAIRAARGRRMTARREETPAFIALTVS